jgi:single-stranded DNA-binding protein
MNLNDVKIVGNLVKDPEIQHTPKGTSVANISLGVNESYSVDDEKRKTTTFVDVQVWGVSAETREIGSKRAGNLCRRSASTRRMGGQGDREKSIQVVCQGR